MLGLLAITGVAGGDSILPPGSTSDAAEALLQSQDAERCDHLHQPFCPKAMVCGCRLIRV